MKLIAVRTMVFLILPAALLPFADVSPLPAQEPSAEAQKHYTSAKELLKKGERNKAIAELKAAIRLSPEFIEAHQDYITHQTIDAADLVKEYEKRAIERAESAIFHYLLGRAYAKAGRNQDGAAEYRKSLELSPGYSWALMELGAEALKDDNPVQAREYFEQARLKAGENLTLRFQLASRLQSVRNYESALAETKWVLQHDSAYFAAYPVFWRAKLGLTSASEEAQAEVLKSIEDLESRHAESPGSLESVMRGYQIFFDDKAAEAVRKRILTLDPQYFAHSGGARFFVMTAEGKSLEFSGPELNRAMEAMKLSDPKEQIEVYRQIAEETKDENLKLWFLYPREFEAHLKAGDLESAERLAEQMERVVDPFLAARNSQKLAEAYLAKKIELDRAHSHIDGAIESARREVARLESAKSTGQALVPARRMLANSLNTRGRILLARERTEAALPALEESWQLHETESIVFDLALAYEKLGRMDEAVRMLVMAISFDGPKKQEARTALDRIYGDRERATPLAVLLEDAAAKRKMSAAESSGRTTEANVLEGKTAPEFELASVKGEPTRLSDLRGNVVLLNFWATW